MTSVITDVDRATAKTTAMGMVAIGRDAIAVVSTRGTVAHRSLITSGAGKGPATAKDAHACALASSMRMMIVAVVVTLLLSATLPSIIVRSHAHLRRTSTLRPLSKTTSHHPRLLSLLPMPRMGRRTRNGGWKGGNIGIVVGRSKQRPPTMMYSTILIVRDITVVAAAVA